MVNQPTPSPTNYSDVRSHNTPRRTGYYCWGGPGTIRMTHVKYFNAKVDIQSMMTCYDYDTIARTQELFGITDYWATYSWGFSDQNEEEDRAFIVDRLENFKRLGIKVHAYIQGPNLVYEDFKHTDWWARDEKNRLVPYYRGRRVCSIHNAGFVEYISNKIKGTYDLGFDGIYIDNIQHGQLGVPAQPGKLPIVFSGDYSPPARAQFRQETGHDIPDDFERDEALTREYLDFRVRSNTRFITQMSEIAHAGGMEFGTNFYDPKFDPTYVYAIDIQKLAEVQDYILFENHALPANDGKKHNGYIEQLIREQNITKPVFIVSYEHGVGMSPQFEQWHLDNLFSEAEKANFNLCLKGGEFTTNGKWHCMYLDNLQPPRRDKVLPRQTVSQEAEALQVLLNYRLFRWILKRTYNPIYRIAFEWRIFRFIVRIVYDTTLK